jgi:hypothetical protein
MDPNSSQFTVENREGRLVESRPLSLRTADDVGAFGRRMREVATGTTGQLVICGDYRRIAVLTQGVADAVVAMMSSTNPRIDRSAVLLASEHATFNLQIERVVREAGNPMRRTFRAVPELEKWLGEVLGPAEKTRLRQFLAS